MQKAPNASQRPFSPPSFPARRKRRGRRRRVRNDHDGTSRRKRRLFSSVLVSSFPNRKLNLRFGFYGKSAATSQALRASIPTPFVPSGHFPLIGGIGPWEGSLFLQLFPLLPAENRPGAVAALRRNKVIDKVIMVITTAFVSMPSFIAGALLLTIFAVSLHLLPANGAQKNGLILPVVTLALYPMAYITRLTRSSMLDVLGQDYIRTARAKGVPGFKVIFGHALKNSLIPVITYFGPMLAYIVTGSIVVEQIFAVPGIGRAFVNSITGRDYPLIMGTTIILACLIIIMNLVSDLLYKIVDPRIELD